MNLLVDRPRLQDSLLAAIAGAFAVASLATDLGQGGTTPTTLSYALAVGAVLALLRRRSHPIVVLGVVAVSRLVLSLSIGDSVALVLAAMIALFTVANTGERRTNVPLAVAVALAMAVVVAIVDNEAFLPEFLGEAALLLLPIAVGDAVRSRAERMRNLIETEADQRVSAERLRIARDLHDVVAHGLSTIAIQSGIAAHLLDRDPGQAKEALETINQTGKSALEELRAMVGVLRSTDDAPLRPTPTDPNDLAELLEGAANAGVPVTVSTTGSFPEDVGDSCVVALHRIVQEALTNVARHAGPSKTTLSIDHHPYEVRVTIANEAGTAPDTTVASTGVGIIGMTERAEALGGTLTATQTAAGGFEVAAVLPYQRTRDRS